MRRLQSRHSFLKYTDSRKEIGKFIADVLYIQKGLSGNSYRHLAGRIVVLILHQLDDKHIFDTIIRSLINIQYCY